MAVTRRGLSRGTLLVAAVPIAWLAMTPLLGVVVGSFGLLLFACYLGSWLVAARWRFAIAAGALVLAMLPWLGLGRGGFHYSDPEHKLPSLTTSAETRARLARVYFLAEGPLMVAADAGPEFDRLIYSVDWGVAHVRRFILFVFWTGIAIVFALSGAIGLASPAAAGAENPESVPRWTRVWTSIKAAGMSAAGIFVVGSVASALAWVVFSPPGGDEVAFGYFITNALLPAALVGGPVIACVRHGGFPRSIRLAVYGALAGALVAADYAATLDAYDGWTSMRPLVLYTQLAALGGAVAVACAYTLWRSAPPGLSKRLFGREAS